MHQRRRNSLRRWHRHRKSHQIPLGQALRDVLGDVEFCPSMRIVRKHPRVSCRPAVDQTAVAPPFRRQQPLPTKLHQLPQVAHQGLQVYQPPHLCLAPPPRRQIHARPRQVQLAILDVPMPVCCGRSSQAPPIRGILQARKMTACPVSRTSFPHRSRESPRCENFPRRELPQTLPHRFLELCICLQNPAPLPCRAGAPGAF